MFLTSSRYSPSPTMHELFLLLKAQHLAPLEEGNGRSRGHTELTEMKRYENQLQHFCKKNVLKSTSQTDALRRGSHSGAIDGVRRLAAVWQKKGIFLVS